jgi:hypothetical protein
LIGDLKENLSSFEVWGFKALTDSSVMFIVNDRMVRLRFSMKYSRHRSVPLQHPKTNVAAARVALIVYRVL